MKQIGDSTNDIGFLAPHKWDVSRSLRKLDELAKVLKGIGRKRILILCHNNPDPDAIASATGFRFLLSKKFEVAATIAYGGAVARAENKTMIQRLRIKMTQLTSVDVAHQYGIVLMDAQPGTGNSLIDGKSASPMIVIDHHPLRKASLGAAFHDIRPRYGATSTIITEYLAATSMIPSRSVANALLYGIKTDTNSLVRATSKVDFTAFNFLSPLTNPRAIGCIERPSLPQDYFQDYLKGLSKTALYKDLAVSNLGLIHSEAIVPELADLLLRIRGVRWSLCIGQGADSMTVSLRCISRKCKAGRVIQKIIGKAGTAGGHREMAGGQIPLDSMTESEILEMPRRIIGRLLDLLDKRGAHPRKLAESLPELASWT